MNSPQVHRLARIREGVEDEFEVIGNSDPHDRA
jgi:hypothetical protein